MARPTVEGWGDWSWDGKLSLKKILGENDEIMKLSAQWGRLRSSHCTPCALFACLLNVLSTVSFASVLNAKGGVPICLSDLSNVAATSASHRPQLDSGLKVSKISITFLGFRCCVTTAPYFVWNANLYTKFLVSPYQWTLTGLLLPNGSVPRFSIFREIIKSVRKLHWMINIPPHPAQPMSDIVSSLRGNSNTLRSPRYQTCGPVNSPQHIHQHLIYTQNMSCTFLLCRWYYFERSVCMVNSNLFWAFQGFRCSFENNGQEPGCEQCASWYLDTSLDSATTFLWRQFPHCGVYVLWRICFCIATDHFQAFRQSLSCDWRFSGCGCAKGTKTDIQLYSICKYNHIYIYVCLSVYRSPFLVLVYLSIYLSI